MDTKIINGRTIADEIAKKLKGELETLSTIPHLAIIQIGEDAATSQFIAMKQKRADEIGIKTTLFQFPANAPQNDIAAVIDRLNNDSDEEDAPVHGIILQLPVPIGSEELIDRINFEKDVDRLSVHSLGMIQHADLDQMKIFCPAVVRGILTLLEYENILVQTKHVVIVNNSSAIGLPLATALSRMNATVTICNEFTKDLESITSKADILISATGIPELITAKHVKNGAIVIDVGSGVNKQTGKICGDVKLDEVEPLVSQITPVPGGVGPMTIISLLESTVEVTKLTVE